MDRAMEERFDSAPDGDSPGLTELTERPAPAEPPESLTIAPGGDRGNAELILSVLAGTTLLPFIQGVFTKAGEETLTLIRSKLRRGERHKAKAEIREAGVVSLGDPEARVILQLPETLSQTMALRLGTVRLPVTHDGWLIVRWDAGLAQWRVDEVPEPPVTVILPG